MPSPQNRRSKVISRIQALLGHQVHVAAVHVAVVEVGRGHEVAEVQLAQLALEAHLHLVVGLGRPGRLEARLA